MRPDEIRAASPGGETIEELFKALESPLLAYALRYAGARETAEDVVQEAFMKLHEQFSQVDKPRPWLYRTVHNLALNRRRDAKKTLPLNPLLPKMNHSLPSRNRPMPACRPMNRCYGWKALARFV